MFRENSRSPQETTTATPSRSDGEEVEEHSTVPRNPSPTPKTNSEVLGSMDTLVSLAKVQRDQAETFRMWAAQFQTFKNNVMKFMDQTSDVLQKNEKKITTLQRVVRKIASDMDE
ncbi:hypothetical protein CAEBREN_07299 [Caenorhabditis brenneri]|uniref:Uncharacterized protein n=1 Tax=Caenorhabditis brenneri TaxID=135651 RepID=G0N7K7_CAEBE|nr:hypothetical protein CAEBREN_07299 [Caenorhabditis brenneri]